MMYPKTYGESYCLWMEAPRRVTESFWAFRITAGRDSKDYRGLGFRVYRLGQGLG